MTAPHRHLGARLPSDTRQSARTYRDGRDIPERFGPEHSGLADEGQPAQVCTICRFWAAAFVRDGCRYVRPWLLSAMR